jgi:hypothetical protein
MVFIYSVTKFYFDFDFMFIATIIAVINENEIPAKRPTKNDMMSNIYITS